MMQLLDATDVTQRLKSVNTLFRFHRGYAPDPDTVSQMVFSPIDNPTLNLMGNWTPKWMAYDANVEQQQEVGPIAEKLNELTKANLTSMESQPDKDKKEVSEKLYDITLSPDVKRLRSPNEMLFNFLAKDYAVWANVAALDLLEKPDRALDKEWYKEKLFQFPDVNIIARVKAADVDPEFKHKIWGNSTSAEVVDKLSAIAIVGGVLTATTRNSTKVMRALNETDVVEKLMTKVSPETARVITRNVMKAKRIILDAATIPVTGMPAGGGKGGKIARDIVEASGDGKKLLDDVEAEINRFIPPDLDEGTAYSKIIQRIFDDPTVPEPIKEFLTDFTYKVRNTKEAQLKAENFVKRNFDTALMIAKAVDTKDEKGVFIKVAMMKKLAADGNWDEATKVYKSTALTATEYGRGVQAFSTLDMDSPEGVLTYTQREIENFNNTGTTNQARKTKTKRTAKDIEEELEIRTAKTRKPGKKKDKEELENSDILAAKVIARSKASIKEPSPEKIDADKFLIEELYKTAEATLPDIPKKQKVALMERIKAFYTKLDEGELTYEEAKAKVLKTFSEEKDSAKRELLLDAIDKYQTSSANPLIHSTTVKKALHEELKSKHIDLKDLIKTSLQNQFHNEAEIVQGMIAKGFSEKAANEFGKLLVKELGTQVAGKKAQILKQMMRKVPKREQQTVLEKIKKLSNVGALDKDDYLDLARAKLGLANLSQDSAKRIHLKAQAIQNMPENVDKEFARIDLIGDISALRPQTRGEKVQDVLGVSRALMSSYDLSAFRQAALVVPSHPIIAVKKISGMTRSMFDEKFYVKAMYGIKQDPMYKVGQSGDIKLAITDMHSTVTNEEAFRSTLAEKIPVIGRQIRGSNRAYVYLLNSMRQEIFNQLHKKAAKSGAIAERPELVSHLADFINHSTGRGSIKGLERSMNILGQAWFSPRLMMSRVKVFNHILMPNVDPFVRKEALKQLILFGGAVSSILGIAQLGGAKVETDSRSADFAKIKVGDTRFDIMGGYQQYAVLGTRLGLAGINRAFDQDIPEVLSSTTGRETTLGEGYKPATALTILGRFTETKENPIVSFVTDAIRGYDFQGEKFDPASEIGQRITSLTAQNLYELRNEEPWLFVAGGVASIFGTGVQTYGRSTQDILQTKKDFMISIGKGGDPERSNALMNVKDALRAGDQNAVDHYTKKYINAGGKKEDFIKSLHTMHPLHGMTQKEVNQFVSTLSPEEKQKLKEEKDRYYKEFSPDGK